jgi:diguanylate cyclase (GGDEF)-like protein
MHVLEAGTAREGQRLLNSESVALMVVDGLLPDARGVQWIEQLRAQGERVPIVFISAYWRDLSTYRKLTDELGVSLVLYKPFDAERFVEKVVSELGISLEPDMPELTEPKPHPSVELELDIELLEAEEEPEQTESLPSLPDVADLVREYRDSLPQRVTELEQLVRAVPQRASLLPEAILRAHRLRGTAGTYGFPAVSTAAGELEDLLLGVQSESESWGATWPRLERALHDARLVVGRAVSSHEGEGEEQPLPPEAEVVLVVDEDAAFTLLVGRFVREQMMQVALATTPSEALAKAREAQPAAAIVDLHVAENRGLELVSELRALRADLPIAVVSFDDGLSARLSALRAGATLFLTKPFSHRDFTAAMRQLLSGATAMRERVLVLSNELGVREPVLHALLLDDIEGRGLSLCEDLFLSLSELRPDLLIVDAQAVPVPVHELLAALSLTPTLRDLPVVILSDEGAKIAPLGRAVVLPRTSEPSLLVAHVKVRLLEGRLAQQRLGVDNLTGLPSRRAFLDALDVRLSEAQRTGRPLAVVVLDVDHMQALNDRWGWEFGDAVLATLAQVLAERMRNEDIRCRWGRDEFVLLLPGQGQESAERAVERLLLELAKVRVQVSDVEAVEVSCSVGIATFPNDGLTGAALVYAAETRLCARHSHEAVQGRESSPTP